MAHQHLTRSFALLPLAGALAGGLPLVSCDQPGAATRTPASPPPTTTPTTTTPASTPAPDQSTPDLKPAEAKPELNPTTKPTALKPVEPAGEASKAGFITLELGGKRFSLEIAATPARRFHGLSGRTQIPADAGMLFVFPDNQTAVQNFVMRDCPVPIDIVYLDGTGRVLATHAMTPEPARQRDEIENTLPFPNAPDWSRTNEQYENRLKKYSSRFPSQFVVELAGGTLKALPSPLKTGDKVSAQWRDLVTKAR